MPVGVDRRGRVTLTAPRWVKSPTRVGAFTQAAAGPEAGRQQATSDNKRFRGNAPAGEGAGAGSPRPSEHFR